MPRVLFCCTNYDDFLSEVFYDSKMNLHDSQKRRQTVTSTFKVCHITDLFVRGRSVNRE